MSSFPKEHQLEVHFLRLKTGRLEFGEGTSCWKQELSWFSWDRVNFHKNPVGGTAHGRWESCSVFPCSYQ